MSLQDAKQYIAEALKKPDVNVILINRTPTPIPNDFSIWQVETLLNQAQDLLERCQREKAYYDDLRAKWVITGVDFLAEESELALQEKRVAEEVSRFQHAIYSKETKAEKIYLKEEADELPGWGEIKRVLEWARTNSEGVQTHTIAADEYKTKRLHRRESETLEAKQKQTDLALKDAERFDGYREISSHGPRQEV